MDDGNAAALAETLATIAAQRRQPDGLSAIRMHEHWWVPSMTWVVIFVINGVRDPQALACFGHTALQNAVCSALYADLYRYDTDKKRIRPGFRLSPDPWGIGSELLRDGAWMFRRSVLVADTCLLRAGDVRLALACRLPVARILHIPLILSHCPMAAPPFTPCSGLSQSRGTLHRICRFRDPCRSFLAQSR